MCSIGGILAYNSLGQSNSYNTNEEQKRLTREEGYNRGSKQPFENIDEEMVMNEDTFNGTVPRETSNQGKQRKIAKRRLNTENPDIFINSSRDSLAKISKETSNFESAKFLKEKKGLKASLRKKNKKQNFLTKTATFIERSQPLESSQGLPYNLNSLVSSGLDESISSNQSSSKSLKMKE